MDTDPAVLAIGAQPGQIVKITRKSQTAKYATFYRFVIESESGGTSKVIIEPVEEE